MFEPEVWRMVRTLERERADQGVYWRTRLAEERRGAGRLSRIGRVLRLDRRPQAPVTARLEHALPGRGG
jgi:hypothetical protein